MPRSSKEEEIRDSLRVYLERVVHLAPEECPLNVRSVSEALKVSPTTIYKYRLEEEVKAAAKRQMENAHLTGKALERRNYMATIQDLKRQLEQERERNKKLVAHITLMEANAARLGFDPEEMYRPMVKPIRSVTRAGANRDQNSRGRKHWARSN